MYKTRHNSPKLMLVLPICWSTVCGELPLIINPMPLSYSPFISHQFMDKFSYGRSFFLLHCSLLFPDLALLDPSWILAESLSGLSSPLSVDRRSSPNLHKENSFSHVYWKKRKLPVPPKWTKEKKNPCSSDRSTSFLIPQASQGTPATQWHTLLLQNNLLESVLSPFWNIVQCNKNYYAEANHGP